MGYCYDSRGRLVCDSCGTAGEVRKVRCPYGYCPPPALCPACKEKHKDKLTKAAHARCKAGSDEMAMRDRERSEMLAAGKALRCSALGVGDGLVHVLFQRQDGSCEGWYMVDETYHAFPLLTNVTPDDFRAHGALAPAPDEFDFGGSTKQVSLAAFFGV